MRVLIPRQEVTSADRQWAEQCQPGDVVRYTKGSKTHGIEAGEYARVERTEATANQVTISRQNGAEVTYDPRRLQGVTLYREDERAFSTGDRLQFTAPYRAQGVANRERGTVKTIDPDGRLHVRLDSGRTVAFTARQHPQIDHGYAVTSHSSQGQTADRVLVQIDTERTGEKLVNRRMAYVAVSRGRYDAQIYTNDRARLAQALASSLAREVSHGSAIEPHATAPKGHAERTSTKSPDASMAHSPMSR